MIFEMDLNLRSWLIFEMNLNHKNWHKHMIMQLQHFELLHVNFLTRLLLKEEQRLKLGDPNLP